MPKVSYHHHSATQRKEMLRHLSRVLGAAQNKKALSRLLEQLLTPSEVVMLSRRLRIARELIKGESYRAIRAKLKVGISTVGMVDRWLTSTFPGYPRARTRKNNQPRRTNNRDKIRRDPDMFGSFASVRHRYGAEFLLIKLLLDS